MTLDMKAVEELLRGISGSGEGNLCVTEEHMAKAIMTRKYQSRIGTEHRAEVVRGWLATEVDEGRATLVNTARQEWMPAQERTLDRECSRRSTKRRGKSSRDHWSARKQKVR